MPTNVDIPALGESVTEATLVKWLKKDGERVEAAEPIAELETDKANVDLPAPVAGTLRRVKDEGETVHIGDTVARIDEGAGASAPAKPPASPGDTAKPKAPPAPAKSDQPLSPAVRRMVEENKLKPDEIKATGPGGRITKEDVVKHLDQPKAAPAPAPAEAETESADEEEEAPSSSQPTLAPAAQQQQVKPAPAPLPTMGGFSSDGVKRVPMTKIRRRIAERLVHAQHTAAILTTFNEIDMSAVLDLRAKYKDRFMEKFGVSLGLMSFFARACALALKEFPRVNAQIDANDIVYYQHVHLGIAVSTDRGLAVPVLRNVDTMSFARIEAEIKRLASAVRDGKLNLEELTGGTFTITNGGVFGSLLSTPIINPPQSGILGMHAIQKRPVAIGDKIEIRPMMYVALSYDHRLIDGRESVTFLVRVKELLEDPARLMLEI